MLKMLDTTDPIKISVVEVPDLDRVKHTGSDQNKNVTQKTKKVPEKKSPYITMFVAEVLGTAMLMFLGCMGGIKTDLPNIPSIQGGLSFGLTVMIIINLFGHISGAHLNPSVTLATVLFGILEPLMGAVYVLAQFIGATLGYGLLKILISEDYVGVGFCTTEVDPKLTAIQALGIEIVITTVLVFFCCSVWDKRNEDKPDSVSLRFGLAVACISIVAGPLTGASMNTARSVAPLIFGGSWDNHWIYWVGPLLAPFLACGIYKFLFDAPQEEESSLSKEEQIYLEETAQRGAEKV